MVKVGTHEGAARLAVYIILNNPEIIDGISRGRAFPDTYKELIERLRDIINTFDVILAYTDGDCHGKL